MKYLIFDPWAKNAPTRSYGLLDENMAPYDLPNKTPQTFVLGGGGGLFPIYLALGLQLVF